MALSIRGAGRRPAVTPQSDSGWFALAFLGLALLLLLGRLILTPTIGLPMNFLVVFAAAGAAGFVAIYAVVLRRDRSLSAAGTMAVGLVAATWLVAEAVSPNYQHVTLGEGDSGVTVTVSQGAVITLQLPANPSTGYDWEATISNQSVLKETSAPVFKPSSSAIGTGGTYTFQYQAKGSGRSDLTLVYRRAWETGVAPLRTFTVTIVAR